MREHGCERALEVVDHRLVVPRRRRKSQALGAARYRRMVDGLQVGAELFEQPMRHGVAARSLADDDRQDLRSGIRGGEAEPFERGASAVHVRPQSLALALARAQVPHARERSTRDGRRQAGREDEAGREAAHEVHEHRGTGDEAADRAVSLAEPALDEVHLIGEARGCDEPGAARAVHAHGMRLVDVDERSVRTRHANQRAQGREIAVHGVEGLEGDEARIRGITLREHRIERAGIVMREDDTRRAAATDAGDHRCVVRRVGVDRASGQMTAERGERRVVGDIAGPEHEGTALAVQVGELRFERDEGRVRSGDVPRAARTRAVAFEGLVGCPDGDRMMAHAEIVVAAPDDDLACRSIVAPPLHPRKRTGETLERAKAPIGACAPQRVEAFPEPAFAVEGPCHASPNAHAGVGVVHFRP